MDIRNPRQMLIQAVIHDIDAAAREVYEPKMRADYTSIDEFYLLSNPSGYFDMLRNRRIERIAEGDLVYKLINSKEEN